jgi:hypothetical protein
MDLEEKEEEVVGVVEDAEAETLATAEEGVAGAVVTMAVAVVTTVVDAVTGAAEEAVTTVGVEETKEEVAEVVVG